MNLKEVGELQPKWETIERLKFNRRKLCSFQKFLAMNFLKIDNTYILCKLGLYLSRYEGHDIPRSFSFNKLVTVSPSHQWRTKIELLKKLLEMNFLFEISSILVIVFWFF